jgi:hypothetical protein
VALLATVAAYLCTKRTIPNVTVFNQDPTKRSNIVRRYHE